MALTAPRTCPLSALICTLMPLLLLQAEGTAGTEVAAGGALGLQLTSSNPNPLASMVLPSQTQLPNPFASDIASLGTVNSASLNPAAPVPVSAPAPAPMHDMQPSARTPYETPAPADTPSTSPTSIGSSAVNAVLRAPLGGVQPIGVMEAWGGDPGTGDGQGFLTSLRIAAGLTVGADDVQTSLTSQGGDGGLRDGAGDVPVSLACLGGLAGLQDGAEVSKSGVSEAEEGIGGKGVELARARSGEDGVLGGEGAGGGTFAAGEVGRGGREGEVKEVNTPERAEDGQASVSAQRALACASSQAAMEPPGRRRSGGAPESLKPFDYGAGFYSAMSSSGAQDFPVEGEDEGGLQAGGTSSDDWEHV